MSSLSFALLHKLVTYLLAGLGLVALTFGGELGPATLAAVAVLFVASWFAEGSLIDNPRYIRAWTMVLVGALGLQLLRSVMGGPVLALAMEFAALLSISRLCNRRTAADYQQISVLAFMQLIAATVLTTDLGYAALFIAFVVATPWMLAVTHLRNEIEAHYPVQREQAHGVDVRRVLESRRIIGPRFLAWTALLSLPLFLITLSLFLLFPRVGLGLIGLGGARGQHVAGFGSDIELGGFGVIRDDPTVVLRVTPSRPLSSGEEAIFLRMRGTAFDRYDGRRWTRTAEPAKRLSSMSEYYPLKREQKPGEDLELKIVLDRLEEPVLFMPAGTVGFKIPTRGLRRRRVQHSITRGHGLDLRYQSNEEMGIVYTAVVGLQPQDRDVPIAQDVPLTRYLQLPKGHERVIALARRVAGDAADREQAARRILKYLRDDGNFQYSLEQPPVGAGDNPLDVFLFEARRGHCEYFATAMAVMLRALRVPARNVTGFVGGKYNAFGRYYALRQGDAHSWVEALLPGRGWVTFDPTPPAHVVMGPQDHLFSAFREALDAVRTYWMTNVIGYDLRTQVTFLRNVRDWFKIGLDRGDKAAGEQGRGPTGASAREQLLPWVRALLVGVGVAVLAWALWRLRGRRVRPRGGLSEDAARARRLYLRLERALRKQGRARAPATTPEAHARRLREDGFASAQTVEEVTGAYLRARYGGGSLDRAEVRRLQRAVDELERAA